jgi:SSS family solute:Na+ symporter
VNSISTIFTLDIFKKYIKTDSSEANLVWVGRITVWVAMIVALFFTWEDILGIGGEGGFTFIQKYTGFISPGVFAMFILGMFWKQTTGAAAVVGVITGFVLSVVFNNYAPDWFGHETILYTAYPNGRGGFEIPFLICMGWSFSFTALLMILISLGGPRINEKAFIFEKGMFAVQPRTKVMIIITVILLAAIYTKFW